MSDVIRRSCPCGETFSGWSEPMTGAEKVAAMFDADHAQHRAVSPEAWCDCQATDGPGPWHPHGDTPWCPPPCQSVGPRIGSDAPRCINPRGHRNDHLAHSSWHHEIKRWL